MFIIFIGSGGSSSSSSSCSGGSDRTNNNSIQFTSIQFMFINVPSQQPDDQLRRKHIKQTNIKEQYTGHIANKHIQNKRHTT